MSSILDAYLEWAKRIWYALGKVFKRKSIKWTWYQLRPYVDSDRDKTYWFGILSSLLDVKWKFRIVLSWNKINKKILVGMPADLEKFLKNLIYTNYPQVELIKVEKSPINFDKGGRFIKLDGKIKEEDDFQKNWVYFSPIRSLFALFDEIEKGEDFQIGFEYDFNIKQPIISLKNDKWEISQEAAKEGLVNFLIGYWSENLSGGFEDEILRFFEMFVKDGKVKAVPHPIKNLIRTSNVINFFHLPISDQFVKNLEYIKYRRLPYPANLPTLENTERNEITILGYTHFRDERIKFGVKKDDKMRHMYIVGKTWMWKSTLISNMARSDMITGSGVWVIDPHGDLIDTLIQHIPSWRTNDVVLFDVGDLDWPIWFNILEYTTSEEKNLIASWVVSTFKKLYGHSWGPRLEYILRNVILTLLDYPKATLLHVTRILTDKNFRKEALDHLQDELVKKFWLNEFEKWSDSQRNEAVSPIINKVGQFLSSPIVRNIFGQDHSKFSLRQLMDEGKIVLINLSKGKIGEDNAAMIGSFLVTKLQIEVMSRANIAEEERQKFFLYIDEFQNFATESFQTIFSEARKYKLGLIVANQYVAQIPEEIRNAIFGNVGSIISFQLWYDDAVLMSSQFKDKVSANDLMSIPRWVAYTKLMIDGVTSEPFSFLTFPLPKPETKGEIIKKVREQSRQRWATPRERVEKAIEYWAKKSFSPTEKAVELAQKQAQKITPPLSQKEKNIKTQTEEAEKKPASDNVKIGEWYDGIIKLKFNYGVFVIIPGIGEGLLHKSEMDVPEGMRWKDLYNVPDKIKVKVKDVKEVDGEQKLVLSQK